MYYQDMKTIKVYIPIRLQSAANLREHWHKKATRNTTQEWAVIEHLKGIELPSYLPCKITLTRVAPRALDYDNLCYAFKHILDRLGMLIKPGTRKGRADADPNIQVDYKQKKGDKNEYAIIIEIAQCYCRL